MLGVVNGGWAEEKKTYIVGIDGDYYPFSYIDKDGSPAGRRGVHSMDCLRDGV